MSTQGKIRVYKRESKKGFTYTYCIEAGRNPATGKRQRVTKSGFKTAKEARAAAQPILNKLLLGENIIESDITFGEYAEQWLEERSQYLKRTTIASLKADIKLANKYFEKAPLKSITRYKYQQFINDYSQGRKRSTVLARHTTIKNIFSYACKYNIIRNNPALNISVPNIISAPKNIKDMYLTKNELTTFLNYVKARKEYPKTIYFYTACAILIFTGMRIGEVCALLWSDIDFENKTIYVRSSMFSKNYNEYERQSTPKNQSSIRAIKIGNTLIDILKEWKRKQFMIRANYKLIPNRATTDFVLTRYADKKETPVITSSLKILMNTINKKHILNKHIHAHLFRHTHVSLLAEAGISLEVIQERLGHSSDATTRNIYLHITEKRKEDAAMIFDRYVIGK